MARKGLFIRAAAGLLAAVALVAGCGGPEQPDAATGPDTGTAAPAFDAGRAFDHLRAQVELGPRPAGSAASRVLIADLADRLPGGRVEPVPGGLANVVSIVPGEAPAVLVGAHHDTKEVPGLVGANDGASGTAVVTELARAFAAREPAPGDRELRFVLFDGEEAPGPGSDDFYERGLRGSKSYLEAHGDEIGEVVVVDFVGDRDLSLPREEGSHPALWRELRSAARRAGHIGSFPDATRPEILDDHTPFRRAGIPAIDLIDFDYPPWHTAGDDLDQVSEDSLRAVGETLAEYLAARTRAR